MFKKKILVTGGNGYIGNYITKMLAYKYQDLQIISMNRKPIEQQKEVDPGTTKFKNVKFVQADALKTETYPEEFKECDSVIHTIGKLLDGVNYQEFLKNGFK